jgi:hypothetical protein
VCYVAFSCLCGYACVLRRCAFGFVCDRHVSRKCSRPRLMLMRLFCFSVVQMVTTSTMRRMLTPRLVRVPQPPHPRHRHPPHRKPQRARNHRAVNMRSSISTRARPHRTLKCQWSRSETLKVSPSTRLPAFVLIFFPVTRALFATSQITAETRCTRMAHSRSRLSVVCSLHARVCDRC